MVIIPHIYFAIHGFRPAKRLFQIFWHAVYAIPHTVKGVSEGGNAALGSRSAEPF